MSASQITQKPMQQTVNGPCQVCSKEMQFIMPTPRIFNEIDVSVLAIAHPPSRCPHCQTIHLPLIAGLSAEGVFELVWKPAKGGRSPMIVGSSDQALRDAIESAKVAEKIRTKGN